MKKDTIWEDFIDIKQENDRLHEMLSAIAFILLTKDKFDDIANEDILEDLSAITLGNYIEYVIGNAKDRKKGIESIAKNSKSFFRRSDVV